METNVTSLHKLYHDDGQSFYCAKSISLYKQNHEASLPDEIRTTFTDLANGVAYFATINSSLLKEIKDNCLKKSGSDFELWIREAFQDSSRNFSFTVAVDEKTDLLNDTHSSPKYKLIWKKVEGKFKIRLAEIPLVVKDLGSVDKDIFDSALKQIEEWKAKAHDIQARESSLKNDLTEYRKHMAQFRDEKTNLEDKLYEAFLPILNSKKDEIGRLKRKVGELPGYQDDTSKEEYASDSETSIKPDKEVKRSKQRNENKRTCHTISDSDESPDSPNSNEDGNQFKLISDSQEILDMSPTLL